MLPIIPFLLTAAKTLGSAALAGGKAAGTAALAGGKTIGSAGLAGASKLPGLVQMGTGKVLSGASQVPGLVSSGIQKGMQSMPQRLIGQSMDLGPTQPSLINTKNALRLGKFLYDQNVANAQTPTYQRQIYTPRIRRSNLQDIINRYN